jgi:hypothetical protein
MSVGAKAPQVISVPISYEQIGCVSFRSVSREGVMGERNTDVYFRRVRVTGNGFERKWIEMAKVIFLAPDSLFPPLRTPFEITHMTTAFLPRWTDAFVRSVHRHVSTSAQVIGPAHYL